MLSSLSYSVVTEWILQFLCGLHLDLVLLLQFFDNYFCTSLLESVVLWLDKGDFPENLHTVCPC